MELRGSQRLKRASSVLSVSGIGLARQKKAKNMDVKRMFLCIRLSQLACAVYITVASFAPEPVGMLRDDHTIQPGRETVIATTYLHLITLAISRVSAYTMYPAMILVFLSKAKALQTFLEGTVLSVFVPFYDLHAVHEAMGLWIAVDVWIHALFHIIRWADQDKLHLCWSTDTGRSGIIVLAITPLICFPMMFEYFKKRLSYEVRKGLHFLCIPFAIGIAFHAPASHIAAIMGTVAGIYLADWAVRWLFMTHKIKSSQFVRLDNGIQLTFENPKEGFATNGGYILLNVPFVSRSQWHAFSVFAHPSPMLPNHSCVCVSKSGDWTAALHQAVQRPTVRPTWIQGPFPSPFKTTEDFDNLVLVASGVGITPAMAAINRFKHDGRKYHLVWACRDASLIEFYAHSIALETTGWVLIYYTGARPLRFRADTKRLPPTVRIFRNRPNLQAVIRRLISGVESGRWLPEELLVWSETFFSKLSTWSAHFAYELEGECALTKIRGIQREILREYAAQDEFEVLLHTFCNLDSDRDALDHPALVDFFRSMVSTTVHPRAEERAFVNIFDPLGTGAVPLEAFRCGLDRLMHEEPAQLPRELSDLGDAALVPVATPSSLLSGVGVFFPPLPPIRDCAPSVPSDASEGESDERAGSVSPLAVEGADVAAATSAASTAAQRPGPRAPAGRNAVEFVRRGVVSSSAFNDPDRIGPCTAASDNKAPLIYKHTTSASSSLFKFPSKRQDIASQLPAGSSQNDEDLETSHRQAAASDLHPLHGMSDASLTGELPQKLLASAHVVFADPHHPALAKSRAALAAPPLQLSEADAVPPSGHSSERSLEHGDGAAGRDGGRVRVRRCSSSEFNLYPHALSELNLFPHALAVNFDQREPSPDASQHPRGLPPGQRAPSVLRRGSGAAAEVTSLRADYVAHLHACRSSAPVEVGAEEGERCGAMQSKASREAWQLLFCGGTSSALRDAMHEVALNLGVSLRTETFDW